MVADDVICLDAKQVRLVVELIRMAEAVAAGQDVPAAGSTNNKLIRRSVNAPVTPLDVLDPELDLSLQPVRPVRV